MSGWLAPLVECGRRPLLGLVSQQFLGMSGSVPSGPSCQLRGRPCLSPHCQRAIRSSEVVARPQTVGSCGHLTCLQLPWQLPLSPGGPAGCLPGERPSVTHKYLESKAG